MIPTAVSTMVSTAPTTLCPPIFIAAELPFVVVVLFPPVSLGTDPLGTAPAVEAPDGLAPPVTDEPEVDDDEVAVGRLVIVVQVPPAVSFGLLSWLQRKEEGRAYRWS